MPYRNKKPCSQPGCSELIKADNTYCQKHRKENNSYRNKRYDRKRDPKIKKFYSSSQWQKVRDRYLKKNPLCEICEKKGRTKAAEVVHHKVEVKENFSKRLDIDNLMSLCKKCHQEVHAKNDTKVIIVAGPPGAGKTTYVLNRKLSFDVMVDVDYLFRALTGMEIYNKPDEVLPFVAEARDAVIERLKRPSEIMTAWVIGGYSSSDERKKKFNELNAESIKVIKPKKEVCFKRIKEDDRRSNNDKWKRLIDDWFQTYEQIEEDDIVR